MSDVKLGETIPGMIEIGRDAVHIAVIPMVADSMMDPGEKVYVSGEMVGVVDPFLPHAVHYGDRFWCFMLPGSVSNLRHDWDHVILGKGESFTARSQYDEERANECRGC